MGAGGAVLTLPSCPAEKVGAQGQNAGCLEGLVLLPEQSFCIWFAVLMESPLASSG